MPLPLASALSPSPLRSKATTDPVLVAMADASIGVFEIDLQTRQTRWSETLFRLFGVDPDEPARAGDRVHPDDVAVRQAAFDAALAQGADAAYAADYRVVHPDGSLHWLSARGRIERHMDAAGEAGMRLVGIVTDQTERHRAHDEIAANEQRRDRFLALLAHDLRNPLAPLHTAAELMRRAEMQPSRIVAIADMLGRQVAQMSQLIDDLVDVSRANQGRIELRRQPVDLRELVEQSVESVRAFVERRRQTVNISLVAAPVVDADPERLGQIVTHLLEHASRSSTEESVIRVSVDQAPSEALLSISDTGGGIEPSRLAQVFDLYPPAEHMAGQRQTLGTSMALVKALTGLHGGSVEAFSAGLGQGATYTVRLPVPARP